nr:MAG TPA: hypothetical protein [Caudoviricetes sp.]
MRSVEELRSSLRPLSFVIAATQRDFCGTSSLCFRILW